MLEKYTCPCCGYKTLTQFGNWDTCGICFWEDDCFQRDNPDDANGPNLVSLRQAKVNFKKFGAIERRFIPSVRKPREDEKNQ